MDLGFDMSVKVLTLDGKTMKADDGTDMTYGKIIGSIILSTTQNESPEDKFKSFGIATKVYGGDKLYLTIDEIAFINKKFGTNATPLVLGRVKEFLEKKFEEPPKTEKK